jgi:glycoside/pentoside/hexuronide:cation symporter, GPH family
VTNSASQHATTPVPSNWRLCGYALASVPLTMAALPIYVNVPKFYADVVGLNLAAIGILLLAARAFDAIQDPLLGFWSDRTRDTKWGRYIWLWIGAPLLVLSMVGLFRPPELSTSAMSWWLVAMLLVVYTAYSMVQISYQAYGAEISDDAVQRTRVTSFREGFGLIGVILAAALPQLLSERMGAREGYAMFAYLFAPTALILILGTILLSPRAQVRKQAVEENAVKNMTLPLKNAHFRRLLIVFMFNGIAASIPATLVLFFIEDVIKAPKMAPALLVAYFVAAAASLPLWVWLSAKMGKGRAWFIGMVLSIIAFVWAFTLGAGDVTAFLVICVLSGVGFGADMALPPSILADVIDEDEKRGLGRNEGAYFGLWNFITKMNLAIAGFAALTALGLLGYVSQGDNSPAALTALAFTYALLPCVLKLGAVAALWWSPFFRATQVSAPTTVIGST